jgi:hypothetical protein
VREMHLLGLSDDGAHVVLVGPDVGTVTLPIDDRLKAAVLGDAAAITPPSSPGPSALSPREIQARLRAGATPETVAAAAGIPIEHVRRFAGPVLDERRHIVEAARAAATGSVSTDAGETLTLGEFVDGYLARFGVEPDSVGWDSRRIDDGAWLVELTYGTGVQQWTAQWRFDAATRRLTVADAAAAAIAAGEDVPPAETRAGGLTLVTPPEPFAAPQPAELASEPAAAASDTPAAPVERAGRKAPRSGRRSGATDRAAEADGVAPGKRATVPSWDEILFGSAPPES